MKKILLTFCVFVSTSLVPNMALAQSGDPNPIDFGPKEPLSIVSETGTHVFSVEIADSREEQIHGYMFKESLPADEGMLFEFENPGIQTIWMKNTPIPLDVIFVRSNGKILKIEHSHKPYTLRSASSEGVVAAVLEIAGGRSKELGIIPGDVVAHAFFDTASLATGKKN